MSKYSKLPKVDSPNIFIAVPMAKDAILHAETARYCSMLNQHPSVVWGYVNGMSPEFSRNSLLEHHFHNDPCWTHVLFIDSDVVPQDNALALLLRLEADVAAGLCPIYADKRPAWNVQIKNGDPWFEMSKTLPREPFETFSVGAGCLLVRREVLVDIKWPWFHIEYQEIFKNEGNGIAVGEDVYFIRKVVDHGYKVIAHPDVKCKHFNKVDMYEYYEAVKAQLEATKAQLNAAKV